MKTFRLWLGRVVGFVAVPFIAWVAIAGNDFAASMLPFVAWFLVAFNALAVVAIGAMVVDRSSKLTELAAILSPRWYRIADVTLGWLTILWLAGHGWYWTAIALTLSLGLEALVRHAVKEEGQKVMGVQA